MGSAPVAYSEENRYQPSGLVERDWCGNTESRACQYLSTEPRMSPQTLSHKQARVGCTQWSHQCQCLQTAQLERMFILGLEPPGPATPEPVHQG